MFTLRAPSPPLTPPYTVGEGHDYPPGRRSHQQVTQAPSSWAFTLDYETMQWMQLDQNGDANSWSLGEFLAQDEVRVMMLDPACTKSLTFREFVNGRLRSRTPDNWTGAPAAEDDGSLDDIPSSTDAFTAAGPGPSIAASDWLPQLTP